MQAFFDVLWYPLKCVRCAQHAIDEGNNTLPMTCIFLTEQIQVTVWKASHSEQEQRPGRFNAGRETGEGLRSLPGGSYWHRSKGFMDTQACRVSKALDTVDRATFLL